MAVVCTHTRSECELHRLHASLGYPAGGGLNVYSLYVCTRSQSRYSAMFPVSTLFPCGLISHLEHPNCAWFMLKVVVKMHHMITWVAPVV